MATTRRKPMKPGAQILLSLGLLLFLGILTFIIYRYPLQVGRYFERALLIVLSTFMIILILRHFILVWFSYLQVRELSKMEIEDITPFVSIIVPAYNEAEVVERSLASLIELHYPHFEIIAVDDGSTDDTYDRMKRLEGNHAGVQVTVLRKENSGKADTLNYGIRRSRAPIVVCMDSDSRLSADAIRYAVRHFADESVGAVAGNVKVVNRHNIWTKLQALEYIEGLNIVRNAQSFFRAVNVIPGPLGIFRRAVLDRVGGYDSDTFAEDFDLTVKVLADGWKVTYEPMAIAYTEAPETLIDIIQQRYRWTRGILQTLRKQKRLLGRSGSHITTPLSLWYMLFEGLAWPALNIFANLFFIWIAIVFNMTKLVVMWWALLLVLDIVLAIHAILMERERLSLAFYALFYRLFYVLIIDVCKMFATLEELLGFDMQWGKLARKGRI